MTERLPEPTLFKDPEEKGYIDQLLRVLRNTLSTYEADIANLTPGSTVNVGDSTYTISSESVISCTVTCVLTLPASPVVGQKHTIRHNIPSGNISLLGNGININGSSSISIVTRYLTRTIQYDGTEWMIL